MPMLFTAKKMIIHSKPQYQGIGVRKIVTQTTMNDKAIEEKNLMDSKILGKQKITSYAQSTRSIKDVTFKCDHINLRVGSFTHRGGHQVAFDCLCQHPT